MNPFELFIDPVLRAPTLGSMLMCLSAALVGVVVFVRKQSLLGEALSHATYPGVGAAIVLAGFFSLERFLGPLILGGAFVSALLGLWVIDRLVHKLKVAPDASLCAVLALFFGAGITLASIAQSGYAHLYRQIQAYLYGQAATMTDIHLVIYGSLALVVLVFVSLFYRAILAICFDPQFAQTNGVMRRFLDPILFLLIVLALVIGIRCVGVILMSAMLIAPATAARQFTNRLSKMFVLSSLFGLISGFVGVYLSVVIKGGANARHSVPTGPMIVLMAGGFSFFALFFAPKRGLVMRYFRIAKFRSQCVQENLLKTVWRLSEGKHTPIEFQKIAKKQGFSHLYLRFLLLRLCMQKKLQRAGSFYSLTIKGAKFGARIVRLHRLWEVYLVNSLGLNVKRVHTSAEEMEHILTPELEGKLTELLDDPKQDPHDQPIPSQDEVMSHG